MHKLMRVSAAIALILCASSVAAEELSCSTATSFRGGGSKGADLKLTVEAGKVVFLSASTFIASGKEGGAYTCSIDSTPQESKVRWSGTEARAVLSITDNSSNEESILSISRLAQGYRVTFEKAWSGYCGFGAEFPQSITLTRGKKKCSVAE